jgi:hypothetical protein
MERCDRCGLESEPIRTSVFSTDRLCSPCLEEEMQGAGCPDEEPLSADAWERHASPAGFAGPGKDGINFHR